MMIIRLAGLNIAIANRYQFVERQCRNYVVTDVSKADCDMHISVTDDEISREMSVGEQRSSADYAESLCIYRAICHQLPRFDAFLMHAAVISVDGEAYAFTAKSGTGKTTHITLWKKLLGEQVKIVNGDKPIIRFEDGVPYAYGTPWCGKEGYNANTRAPLVALCFVERASINTIQAFDGAPMIGRLMGQLLLPGEPGEVVTLMTLVDRLVGAVRCYLLGCNMELEAARVAYDGMRRGGGA